MGPGEGREGRGEERRRREERGGEGGFPKSLPLKNPTSAIGNGYRNNATEWSGRKSQRSHCVDQT